MPVSEERLTATVTRTRRRHPHMYEHNPVAGLLVESMAASAAPEHEHAIRDAGTFLLDLLRADHPEGPHLTLPVAIRVLTRDEARPLSEVCGYLAETARRDLLLAISVQALAGTSGRRRRGADADGQREAVTRALYLLLRMFDAQEEVDELHRRFHAE